MEKRISIFLVCILVIMALLAMPVTTACSKPTTTTTSGPAPVPAPAPAPAPASKPAPAAPIVLKFASHSPGTRQPYIFFEKEWAPKIEQLTNGQVKFEYYWGGVLGKGPDAYKMVTSGICDIALVVPLYFPGTFPLTDCGTIPGFWPANQPEKCNCVARKIWDKYLINTEWSGVKVLFIHLGSPGFSLQTTKKAIRTLTDFKGMQIGGGGQSLRCLESVGATPVEVVMGEAYVALERGMIDGYLCPTAGFAQWGYMEKTKYHTFFDVGGISSAYAMNLNTWNKLPADIKKAFEDTKEWTLDSIMKTEIDSTNEAIQKYKNAGIEIINFSPEENAKVQKLLKPIADEWCVKMDAKGLPGTEMWNEAQRLAATECNK